MDANRTIAPPGAWEEALLPGAWTRPCHGPAPDMRLFLGLPEGPPPPSGYPLVVILDAADHFVLMHDAARRLARRPAATGVGPAVILGVDFDGRREDRTRWRHRALTWSAPEDARSLPPGHEAGGGAAFLQTLLSLVGSLDAGVTLDPDMRSLFGHSLAGGFALHALAADAGFGVYGAVSPSIWWSPEHLRRRLAHGTLPGSVFIAVGEREEGPAARPHAAERRMIGHAQELGDHLRGQNAPLRVTTEIFPDEDHASVMNVAVTRFLRLACPPPQPL